ncbi:MAG: histidine kinase [Micavibrio aeruginosavorus]|uniref:histidine kinase n=1 Tax=Micavibrio aeruginosavorus TaxID=349221 RepID=A0A2W5PID1_9BACT|nr:MAG: histidine kinase [Micavibrio aeruginosavorus]
MPMKKNKVSQKMKINIPIAMGFVAVLFFFIVTGYLAVNNVKDLRESTALVTRTHEMLLSYNSLLSLMKDAETGQRGYIITGEQSYLEPYTEARKQITLTLQDLRSRRIDNPKYQESVAAIENNVNLKLRELEDTINVRRTKNFNAAYSIIITDQGKAAMDSIRQLLGELTVEEKSLRAGRIDRMDASFKSTLTSGVLSAMCGAFLSLLVAWLLQRSAYTSRRQQWLQDGEIGIANALLGDLTIDQLGEKILKFYADYLDMPVGAFFVKRGGGFRRSATYGVPHNAKLPERFEIGDGLLGQAAKDRKAFILNDIPEGYLTTGSAFGNEKPKHLIVSPILTDGTVNAVIEMGSFDVLSPLALQLIQNTSEAIGVAVRAADYRASLQNLLEETQRQAEELQSQSEELRVSNEELEEQSRALKESQSRLEQQQAELEQTNAQLEEQAQMLETQRDDLSRSNEAVSVKAHELQQASQYKSDFLANMSHELRTPLNSSLILAKLLADNPDGNLTPEQVKFAQTIQSAGNDLLTLINDILDLSKIEAGHMDIHPENVRISRMIEDMSRMFAPMAKNKDIGFKATVDENCSEIIETDRLRLEQILKNLLSNAVKFTSSGSVEIKAAQAGKDHVSFSIIDTGIGISEEHKQTIFEAFRQADGTISRKYGGTGLGLSITRELTRLLKSSIRLESEEGKGSTFTLMVPISFGQGTIDKIETWPNEDTSEKAIANIGSHNNDRNTIQKNSRTILVVEDDASFAEILYSLAQELGFHCLIASTAEEALITAKQYLPSAVILDVGLPDNSGLSVLDRLKRNTQTRHIPVHVISANDYAQTALSLGAVGYMLKPVKREEISDVLKKLEGRLQQKMHRVLIVEDDKTQREAIKKLLASKDVEIVAVGTAADCLENLKSSTFDCMVLDLTLPDASGYSLLETLSKEDDYSFPPVIVYTGKDLSQDAEQKLRRYSKSIIIKGAKSPERLLDEVTLFLHQVVSELPPEQQNMLKLSHNRDAVLEGKKILIVEDDIRNIYSLTNILEPRGAIVQTARNGREALEAMKNAGNDNPISLILMDVMMPEMDGLSATREIRKNKDWKKLPIIMLTAKAMRDDQEKCLDAGANDYMAKPLDVEKLLSLVRVWMPR